jgi:hypothetical protein
MRRRGVVALAAAVPALVVVACASSFETRVPDAHPMPARIAAMPARVILYELAAGGDPTPSAERTLRSAAVVDAAVAAWVRGQGGRTFDGTVVVGTSPRYEELRPWMEQSLQEIAAELVGTAKTHRRSVGDWRWPGDLGAWRTALGADFVLLVRLWDERPTLGRAAINKPERTELACLLSLVDGRIVSCSGASSHGLTLVTDEGEREAIGHVLDGLFSPRANWSR